MGRWLQKACCLALLVTLVIAGVQANLLKVGQTGYPCATEEPQCQSEDAVCIQRGLQHWFCKRRVGARCEMANGQCVSGAMCHGAIDGAKCNCRPGYTQNGTVCVHHTLLTSPTDDDGEDCVC